MGQTENINNILRSVELFLLDYVGQCARICLLTGAIYLLIAVINNGLHPFSAKVLVSAKRFPNLIKYPQESLINRCQCSLSTQHIWNYFRCAFFFLLSYPLQSNYIHLKKSFYLLQCLSLLNQIIVF